MEPKNNDAQNVGESKFKVVMSKIGNKTLKGIKVASGYQAYKDWKSCKADKKKANEIRERVDLMLEQKKEEVNARLYELYQLRLNALKSTVKVFISYLNIINQKCKDKEYSIPTEFDVNQEVIKEFPSINIPKEKSIKLLVAEAIGGGAAIKATPKIVIDGVIKVCKASTGKEIKKLSGAAAKKAAMAWLGGGSVATGGGGIAAGTIVLGAITATVTGIVVVSTAGTLASGFYSKKKTETDEYLKDLEEWAANVERQGAGIEKIELRINELVECTLELEGRAIKALEDFSRCVDKFDPSKKRHQKKFLLCSELVRSISEIVQADVLDEDGNINEITGVLIKNAQTLLNKAL